MPFNPASLRRASFNGIPFWVESGDISAGHRVATTHVPNGTHVNESFGPSAREFEIAAYVAGDGVAYADALLAAAERAHLGHLILPDQPSRRIRLKKATRGFDKTKLGFITVKIEAVAEPVGSAGLTPLILAQQIFGAALGLAGAFGAYAAAIYDTVSGLSGLADAAIGLASGALSDIDALRQLCRLAPEGDASVSAAIGVASAALAALPSAPQAYGEALALAAIALADAADPATLAETMRMLGEPSPAFTLDAGSAGPALAAASTATAALASATRALALAESTARQEWPDRPAAEASRGLAAALFSSALARIGREGHDLRLGLSRLQALTLDRITQSAATLAPLVTVRTRVSLPARVLAHRLYNDPSRTQALWRRAGGAHPSFMPVEFEALAS
jgi:hypothetical protein